MKGIDYSAEDFFNNVIHPLFFNDEKHFINVANSSFFQSVPQKQLDTERTIHDIRLERFHKNVKEDGASLTTLVGYAAQGLAAGTSGQLTSMKINIETEEMYASWAGIGLSVSMGGGYSIIINDSEILLGLHSGWEIYRKYLTQTPNLKGNQVDVWNSYWICHVLSPKFDARNLLDGFELPKPVPCKADKWRKLGLTEFESMNWIKVVFAIAKKYPNRIFTINAFKFADTNQTLGFINLYLPEIKRYYEVRDSLFISSTKSILSDEEIENLSPHYSFKDACKLGTIGLKSIEPDKLREYMPIGSFPYSQGKEYRFSDEESITNYQLFKTWIIAMINKTELLNMASGIAQVLTKIEIDSREAKRGKTTTEQEAKKIFEAKSIKSFINELILVMDKSPKDSNLIRETIEEVLKMPYDLFPLFITLIKFEYTYKNLKK
ncbi:MAG: hypothetical protein QM786_16710 [Breznakibacter sp.]